MRSALSLILLSACLPALATAPAERKRMMEVTREDTVRLGAAREVSTPVRQRPPAVLPRRAPAAVGAAPGAARLIEPVAQACLFDHEALKGASTCLPLGDHAVLPAGWNDRATALRLGPDVVVDLFDGQGLSGSSVTVFSSESRLSRLGFDARASSMRVRSLTASPTTTRTSRSEAARFLISASYGPTMAEIERVANIGPHVWLDEQFRTPPRDRHWAYVVERRGPIGCNPCTARYINATMESFWDQAVRGPDQLRQRTVFALSQLFVVSTVNSSVEIQEDAHAGYLDMLSRNAFGNYRTLLEEVTLHPTMGHYLSHFRNQKGDPISGRVPDENYAREVMQLFSIGLWELNQDGTRRKDARGNDIPSYGQDDVMGLARVLTGWSWAFAGGNSGPTDSNWNGWAGNSGGANWNRLMQLYPQFHSNEEKRFLGVVIPPNTDGRRSLELALDRLFQHPNTAPFVATQLIKRFVSSNPSPAYVSRVAAAFANNGSGVRGDMQAVLRAVLLDTEAQRGDQRNAEASGRLREPMVRFGQWMRAFNAQPSTGAFSIWNLEDPVSSLGQNPLRSPSVFNWYRPDYAPPGAIKSGGLTAPEFQIAHETTVTGYANFVISVVERGFSSIRPNYPDELALAGSPAALVDRLNLLLVAGRLSGANRSLIIDAVAAVPASNPAARVHTAIALTMLTPEFQVQK